MNLGTLLAALSDPAQATVVELPRDQLSPVLEAATQRGFATAVVDLAGCRTRDVLLDRVATALGFPEWFGQNWDALSDCLRDLEWWPAPGYVLVFERSQAWREAAPAEDAILRDVLAEACASWRASGVACWFAFVP